MTTPTGAIGGQHASRSGVVGRVRDVVALLKLRITTLVVITSLGGMALAVRLGAVSSLSVRTAVIAVVGLSMVVTSANMLNMYLERDGDALMERTRDRPLPSGRMNPSHALWAAFVLAVLALPVLAVGVNGLTAALAAWALALYAGFYTPLKRVTSQALLVGAVPGALPPLIGWTAATGEVALPGLALFGVLFFWQIPHFLAIGTLHLDDYTRAGVKVFPAERPMPVVRWHAMGHCLALIVVSLLLALPQAALGATATECRLLVSVCSPTDPSPSLAWTTDVRLTEACRVHKAYMYARRTCESTSRALCSSGRRLNAQLLKQQKTLDSEHARASS